MERSLVLLRYFDRQVPWIQKGLKEVLEVDLSVVDRRFFFAVRMQQFYTALEDLFLQIIRSFEPHNDTGILTRVSLDIPLIRPAVISDQSLSLLERIRVFQQRIESAYDEELDLQELQILQDRLKKGASNLERDLVHFRAYLKKLVG